VGPSLIALVLMEVGPSRWISAKLRNPARNPFGEECDLPRALQAGIVLHHHLTGQAGPAPPHSRVPDEYRVSDGVQFRTSHPVRPPRSPSPAWIQSRRKTSSPGYTSPPALLHLMTPGGRASHSMHGAGKVDMGLEKLRRGDFRVLRRGIRSCPRTMRRWRRGRKRCRLSVRRDHL